MFNIYQNYPKLVSKEITSPRTRKISAIDDHLTPTKKNDFTDLLFFNTVTIVPFGVVILAKSLKAFSFPGVENVLLSSKVTYNQNRKNKIMENFYKKTSH